MGPVRLDRSAFIKGEGRELLELCADLTRIPCEYIRRLTGHHIAGMQDDQLFGAVLIHIAHGKTISGKILIHIPAAQSAPIG